MQENLRIIRKAYRVGPSSIAITIPAYLVETYNIEVGDKLWLDLRDIVKPGESVSFGSH